MPRINPLFTRIDDPGIATIRDRRMLATKMIETQQEALATRLIPTAWEMRQRVFDLLCRQSRHTGDVRRREGRAFFLGVPIEIGEVRNSLGARLVTMEH